MKSSIALACLAATLAVSAPAFATAQQDKMKSCNKEATEKSLKGDERKAYMKSCLSKKAEEEKEAKKTQQQKMTDCNKDAKEKALKGDERKKFMSACLKG